ncbi:MAG: ABC transporter permease [Armatimonadetes bacterium]|nr:ABC transporter permease [Armatimonadota bacterium]
MRTTARATIVELRKLFVQRGSYVGFAVLAAMIGLVVWGMWRKAPDFSRHHPLGSRDMIVAGKVVAAPSVLQFILPATMEVLMPLLIAAVAGGMVAGEVRSGTMRTMLVRPVTRLQLLAAKTAAAWVYTLALCGFAGIGAAALSYAAFGPGDMVSVLGEGLVLFGHEQAVERLALAYGLAAVGRCTLVALAIMFSCLLDNALAAAAVTVASLIVFGALEQIPYFESWRPYFLTHFMDVYKLPLRADVPWHEVLERLAGLAAYTVAALSVGAFAFSRRDIA